MKKILIIIAAALLAVACSRKINQPKTSSIEPKEQPLYI